MKKLILLIIMLISVISVQGALDTNLTSYWKADEGSGNTANDSVAGLKLVNTTGASFTTSQKKLGNSSLDFTGASGNYWRNATGNFNYPRTVNYWVRPTSLTGTRIMTGYGTGTADERIQMQSADVCLWLAPSGGNWKRWCTPANSLSSNTWQMITYTFTSLSDAKIYINGTIQTTTNTSAGTPALPTGSPEIAFGDVVGGGLQFQGQIDEYGEWRRVLNQSEITELYNSGSGLAHPFSSTPAGTNFTLTAINIFNSSSILNFSAVINGTLYNSNVSSGQIITHHLSNQSVLINITNVSASNYFTNQSLNVNTSSNYQISLTPYTQIYAKDRYNSSNITAFSIRYTNNANVSENGTLSTTNGLIQAPLYNATYTLLFFNVTNYFNDTNTSVTASLYLNNHTINATPYTQIYAKDIFNSSSLTSFYITYQSLNGTHNGSSSTTTGMVSIPLYNATYNITISNASLGTQFYSISDTTQIANLYLRNYTFNLYRTNTVNISVYHERNLSLATGVNLTLSLIIENVFSGNYTSSNGTLFLESLSAGDYEIRYSGVQNTTNYPARSYFFTLSNQTYNSISLYIADGANTQEVTNTLYDDVGNKLSGYYIKLLRYYVETNSYLMVDECLTNFNGLCVLNIEISDEDTSVYYKFRIVGEDGTVYKTTDATKVYATELTHFITLSDSITDDLSQLNTISYDLDFLSATNQFRFTWDDSAGLVSNAQLIVYTVTGNGTLTTYNSTTASTSSGTIYIPVSDDNLTTYLAKAYTGTTKVAEASKSFFSSFETFGALGIFATIIILITIIFLGINNPTVAVMLVPVALVLTKLSSLNPISWTIIAVISALSFIIAYVLSKVT